MAKKLNGIGIKTLENPEITVQNIVASADLHTILNLNAIAIGLGLENIEYEPEQFPGLVYRIDVPKVVVLIFSSGKLVVTGGKSPEDCERGCRSRPPAARQHGAFIRTFNLLHYTPFRVLFYGNRKTDGYFTIKRILRHA